MNPDKIVLTQVFLPAKIKMNLKAMSADKNVSLAEYLRHLLIDHARDYSPRP